jgi:hypothetical protein
MQAYNATGVGTGYIAQATGPVTLTVSATGIATVATGAMTITFTAISSSTANIPTFASTNYAPPVGGVVVVSNATGVPNGVFTIISSTATTVVVQSTGVAAATSATSTPVVTVYVPVAGVFAGCKYLSTSQKRTVWSNYWPGSDVASTNVVTGYIINDPNAKFVAQFGNVSVDQGYVNAVVGFNIGTGNTANGISGAFLATLGTTDTTFPFKVVSLVTDPPGVNGTESGAYQKAIVAFNFVSTKALPGV